MQGFLLSNCLDDYVTENNPVRVVETFVDELDLGALGFGGVVPEATGRPAYRPATLLKDLPLRLPQPRCNRAAVWNGKRSATSK